VTCTRLLQLCIEMVLFQTRIEDRKMQKLFSKKINFFLMQKTSELIRNEKVATIS